MVPPSDVTACEAIYNLVKIERLLHFVFTSTWSPNNMESRLHVVMHYFLIQKNACTTCRKLICLSLGQSIIMSATKEINPNFEKEI